MGYSLLEPKKKKKGGGQRKQLGHDCVTVMLKHTPGCGVSGSVCFTGVTHGGDGQANRYFDFGHPVFSSYGRSGGNGRGQ